MRNVKWDELPAVLSAKDLKRVLPLGTRAVYQLFRRPDFPGKRIGRRVLVSRDALRRWLES